MRKRICILMAVAGLSTVAMAQNQYDALPMLGNELNGTARYVGMGGAMNALGADISTMSTNPAGIGLFRKSDVSVSFGFNNNKVTSETDNYTVSDSRTRGSFDQAGFVWSSKIGNETAIRYVNFGFNYHKRANFNRQFSSKMNLGGLSLTQQMANMAWNAGGSSNPIFATLDDVNTFLDSQNPYTSTSYYGLPYLGAMGLRNGFNNASSGVSAGLVDFAYDDSGKLTGMFGWNGTDGEYYSREQGGINQYDLNVAFNVKDRFYLGVTLGLYDLDYSRYSSYGENLSNTATEGGVTYTDQGNFTLDNWYKADGTGVDFKVGMIFRPFEYSPFRIGISASTPVWYSITDKYTACLTSDLAIQSESGDYVTGQSTENLSDYLQPEYVFDYNLTTPWRLNLSMGTSISNVVALDAEYEFEKYSSAKLRERQTDGYGYSYSGDELSGTTAIQSTLKPVHTFRAGIEANFDGFFVRGGYNFRTAPIESTSFKNIAATDETRMNPEYTNDNKRHTATFGLGYHGKRFYADAAYKYDTYKSDFYAFDSENLVPAKLTNERHQVLFTVGARF